VRGFCRSPRLAARIPHGPQLRDLAVSTAAAPTPNFSLAELPNSRSPCKIRDSYDAGLAVDPKAGGWQPGRCDESLDAACSQKLSCRLRAAPVRHELRPRCAELRCARTRFAREVRVPAPRECAWHDWARSHSLRDRAMRVPNACERAQRVSWNHPNHTLARSDHDRRLREGLGQTGETGADLSTISDGRRALPAEPAKPKNSRRVLKL
jgi:hypothetical protein